MVSFTKAAAGSLFFLQILFLISCIDRNEPLNGSSNARPNSASETSVTAKTNVEELSLMIKIPYEAEDAYWNDDGPGNKLTAVLRFAPEDTHRLIADLEKLGPPSAVTLEAETWFPDELKSQSDLKSASALNGKAYRADLFFLDPYNSGRIIRVEGADFFVLELAANR